MNTPLSPKFFVISALASSILLSMSHAHALQALSENDMRRVDGQDGIVAQINYSGVDVDQVYWDDQTGSSTQANTQNTIRTSLNGVTIRPSNAQQKLGVRAEINAGSTTSAGAGNTGLDINATATLGTVRVDKVTLCNGSDSLANCAARPSFGRVTAQADTPIGFHLTTADGLFSKNGFASLSLSLTGMDLSLSQRQNTSVQNALLMNDFNFNFTAQGYMFVDPIQGLVLQTNPVTGSSSSNVGYVDFKRDAQGKPGLNLEFMAQQNTQNGTNSNNARGILRAGANGRMVNGTIQLRGTDDNNSTILGTTPTGNSIAGSSGVAFRLNGEFTNDRDTLPTGVEATSLELGGAGNRTYGLRFSNITPLQTRTGMTGQETSTANAPLNTGRAGLVMDGLYLNSVNANQIYLPVNTRLTGTTLGTTGTNLVSAADYTQNLSGTGETFVVLAVRGMDFAALSRRGQFIYTDANGKVADVSGTTQWGLGLPIYNLNANFAFSPRQSNGATSNDYIVSSNNGVISRAPVSGSERIGFSGGISTQGVNNDGSRTTSILLIDGASNANDAGRPIDYYVGLRNIDLLLNGSGSLGFENGNLNVSMPKLLMAMSAQVAAGYLPGAKYQTCPSGGGCFAPSNNFALPNDVLAGIKLKLSGGIDFSILPRPILTQDSQLVDGVNALQFVGLLRLSPDGTTSVQVTDPVDGSTIGLDRIVGSIGFNNKLIVNRDSAGFNFDFNFNPAKNPDEVFRVKDVNFYPSVNNVVGNKQRLSEVAITGGRLTSELKITPRNGSF